MALFDRKMHDPVTGTARVVDNDGMRSLPGQAVHCPLDLMVEAEGIPPYMVHMTVRPKTGKWPEINQLLPVVLDRSNPTRVEIVWDQVPSLRDRVQLSTAARLEAAHQATAGGSASPAPTGDGLPQDLMRQALADPAAFAETMRGRGMASAQLPWGTQVEGAPPTADPVDRIAKLADLRDRGALTEDEFQAQKKRILGK
jgi:Short C-terminal domain